MKKDDRVSWPRDDRAGNWHGYVVQVRGGKVKVHHGSRPGVEKWLPLEIVRMVEPK